MPASPGLILSQSKPPTDHTPCQTVSFTFFIFLVLWRPQEISGFNSSWIRFSPGYDMAFPPTPSPVRVSLSTRVETVSPIQSAEMEYRVNMRWSLSWRDPRIGLDDGEECLDVDTAYAILPESVASQIWIPDVYIVNAKYSGVKTFNGKLFNLVLHPNSRLSLNFILNATIACAMNFEYYPHDVQNCPMIIQSFAYSTERLVLVWDPVPATPFSIRPTLLIQFMVVTPKTQPFQRFVTVPGLGNVSQLVATFRFERVISSHIVQSFIPSSLVVGLSWFSFWLELDVTAARGSLLMAAILSLELHLLGLKTEFPPVAYVKGVDVWVFGCIFLVFSALAEFVAVKVIFSVTEEEKRANQVYALTKCGARVEEDVCEEEPRPAPETPSYTEYWLWEEISPRIRDLPLSSGDGEEDKRPRSRGPYKKRRLGSVVLSGRSVATSHLPLVEKQLPCCGLTLPLVWSGGGVQEEEEEERGRRVLWREVDNWAKILFPPVFVLFGVGYWVVLVGHANYGD